MQHIRESDIAIVAMTGRFPGARDVETLRRNLWAAVESITFFSDQQLLEAGADPALLTRPGYVPARGIVDDADLFDAAFFDISPLEAEVMDPQHRLFLEHAWELLELAGVDPYRFSEPIGVFAGLPLNRYALSQLDASHPDSPEALEVHLGNTNQYLPTRVSYKLDLRGPSICIQTSCPSSLVAVHLACQSLLSGECELALAGGVSLTTPQHSGYVHHPTDMHSADGHCRPFDASAGGTLFSNGLGIVLLQRLQDALDGGFSVRGVIKGTAVNNDGRAKIGFTAPSIEGQAAVIAEAQAVAGVDAQTITYVETHGSGTPLGDPVEVAALTQAFRQTTQRRGFCAIGSLKSNIGHLGQACGVAGLIKTVLALEHRQIPPTLHFEQPNPEIDFATSPFYVATELSPWAANGGPRRAGVTSLGFGGTNAHVVVEEAPPAETSGPSRRWQLLLLSARTITALDAATVRLGTLLEAHPENELADVAYTLQVGRAELENRRMLVAASLSDAVEALTGADPEHLRSSVEPPCRRAGEPSPVIFLFPGAGSQYIGMGRELYRHEPEFRRHFDRCAEGFMPHLDRDLRQVLHPETGDRQRAVLTLRRASIAMPAIFATSWALAQLWMSWGIRPRAMLGHSLGEYVAACLAGVFPLDDALALVALRGRLFERLPAGGMVSLPLAEADARRRAGADLDVAAINGPSSTVLSGPNAAVEALADRLSREGLEVRTLAIDVAHHSPLVEPILDDFAAAVGALRLAAPEIPYVSNLTGTWITPEQTTDPDYWVRHLRQPVRFSDGLATLLAEERSVLEVGPGHAMSSLVRQQPRAARARCLVTSLPQPDDAQPEDAWMLTSLGRLWLAGAAIDNDGFFAGQRRKRIPLPTYPFERQRYWLQPQLSPPTIDKPAARLPAADWLQLPSWRRTAPAALLEPAPDDGPWLVLSPGSDLANAIIRRLEAAGQRLFIALPGPAFGRLGNHRFHLRPDHPEDHDALLDALDAAGARPCRVLHLGSLGGASQESPGELGLPFLLFFAGAWARRDWDRLFLDVVVRDLHEVTGGEVPAAAETAMLVAPVRVLPQELHGAHCRLIDIAAGRDESWLEQLLAELTVISSEPVVALRGGHRWVSDAEKLPRGDQEGAARLRRQGVYLITGGLGGIGMELAEHLARGWHARLVLTGRTHLPEDRAAWLAEHGEGHPLSQRLRRLEAMEEAGGEVLALTADVSQHDQMAAVLERTRQRFGALHGVIHAAGLPGGGVVAQQTPESLARVLAPKVAGTRILESLLSESPLDFFVLCSSRNALRGRVGTVDYCAANNFLDVFARSNALHPDTYTLAINWCAWQRVGMLARTVAMETMFPHRESHRQAMELGLEPSEGWKAFLGALNSGVAQVIVSTTELTEASPAPDPSWPPTPSEAPPEADSTRQRPALETAYVAPRDRLEERLTALWQEMLGFERIGVHDRFLELGGHSVLAIRLLARLRDREGVQLALPQLFATPTVAGLARAVASTPTTTASEEFEEGAL